MNVDTLKRLGTFFIFLLAQVLVLGRIHLYGVVSPLLYIYFVLQFPHKYPKWAILLWSFAMGLAIDVFQNTPGVAAASLTLIGAIQPYYYELFISHDSMEGQKPSVKTMGMLKFAYYATPLVLLFCLVFFTLDQFSFSNMPYKLLCIVSSTAVILALIFTFELAKKK